MDGVVSDLFFNHEHPHWDSAIKLNKKTGETEGDVTKAIHEDAADFVKLYGSVIIGPLDSAELAQDFLDRV